MAETSLETSLVHVCHAADPGQFVGCGAIVEGGYIATCRHVWRDAGGATGAVVIVFPRSLKEDRKPLTCSAHLADECNDVEGKTPDLVLLLPETMPSDMMILQIARQERLEIGEAFAQAVLRSWGFRDVPIRGVIDDFINDRGERCFNRGNSTAYWFEKGSSGSPVFLKSGQQLAGLVSLAELGPEEEDQAGQLREAFIVPGQTIWFCVGRAKAGAIAERENVDVARFREILSQLGYENVPASEIPQRLEAAIKEMKARAAKAVLPSNTGGDIAATVEAARARLHDLDPQGAVALLKKKRAETAEERKNATAREIRLLEEQAEIERIVCDYDAAKATLRELLNLDPDLVWPWIVLGYLWETTGPLEEAAKTYQAARELAERNGDQKAVGDSCDRIGNVRSKQGDLAGALDSYGEGLAIRDRLAKSDPGNAEWQRALSVSFNNVGNVRSKQGDLAGALTSYGDALAIRDRLAKSDPGNAEWRRDLTLSLNKVGDVRRAQGDLAGALQAYEDGLAIRDRLAKTDPGNVRWQRDLVTSFGRLGLVYQQSGDSMRALDAFRQAQQILSRLTKALCDGIAWVQDHP